MLLFGKLAPNQSNNVETQRSIIRLIFYDVLLRIEKYLTASQVFWLMPMSNWTGMFFRAYWKMVVYRTLSYTLRVLLVPEEPQKTLKSIFQSIISALFIILKIFWTDKITRWWGTSAIIPCHPRAPDRFYRQCQRRRSYTVHERHACYAELPNRERHSDRCPRLVRYLR